MNPDRLAYSPAEAAESLGVGLTLMTRLIATGEIRSVKLGSRRLIPADALAEMMARR